MAEGLAPDFEAGDEGAMGLEDGYLLSSPGNGLFAGVERDPRLRC